MSSGKRSNPAIKCDMSILSTQVVGRVQPANM